MSVSALDMKIRLVQRGVRQVEVATKLGMDEGQMSRILNGREKWPEGFPARFDEAVDAVAHEKAARLLGETEAPRA